MTSRLRIALQKSGRLSDDSLSLLLECGISLNPPKGGGSRLKTEALNFPLELLFLRDDDIPRYVADGVAHVGIVGENVVLEEAQALAVVERLGFSKCKLSLAVPRNSEIKEISGLQGKRIATSYPRILQEYLRREGISASIHQISGSVEIAPSIGLADAICDIVGSGSTLFSNGLVELHTVLRSEAVLVTSKHFAESKVSTEDSPEGILEKLLFRIQAVGRARAMKYILLNTPNEAISSIVELLPGVRSPTVIPLAREGWSSLHSVVEENQFWSVIEQLRKVGAEGILVLSIEKMIL
jgi:ATP phosphoribosyltransferase